VKEGLGEFIKSPLLVSVPSSPLQIRCGKIFKCNILRDGGVLIFCSMCSK